jgi:multidrug transporter EmrE-like cation transporter
MQLGFQITSLPVKPILYVCAGAMLYIFSFLAWLVILTRQELSVAYPIAIGLTLTFSTIGAVVYLEEPVSIGRTAGIVFYIFRYLVNRALLRSEAAQPLRVMSR